MKISYLKWPNYFSDIKASIESRLAIKTSPPLDMRIFKFTLTNCGGEIMHTLHHILSISDKHKGENQDT